MKALRVAAPDTGAYVNECDYFQPDWQRAFWGPNYARLAASNAATTPTASSPSTTASAARAGAPMASPEPPSGVDTGRRRFGPAAGKFGLKNSRMSGLGSKRSSAPRRRADLRYDR